MSFIQQLSRPPRLSFKDNSFYLLDTMVLTTLLLPFMLFHFVDAATNFTQCLFDVRSSIYGPYAGVDNTGMRVPDILRATAIPYVVCVEKCGSAPEPFAWSIFGQEFSAWLLPYLALLSQLPFGAQDKWDNLLAVFLAVGSPTLAAYSVTITVLNGRWISRLFSTYSYPNAQHATRILSSLQQSPLRVNLDGFLLSSLVVLPENDDWWSELVVWLNFTYTWSISAVASIAWVVIAYVFTIVDSFTDDVATTVETNGQAVGSIWLWLIPVVVSWLQISPKCDSVRVKQALERANMIAYVASYDHNVIPAAMVNSQRAIYLCSDRDHRLYIDQHISAPVYNYARIFSWTTAVQKVAMCFSNATRHVEFFEPVNPEATWVLGDRHLRIHPENRWGSSVQVETYCISESNDGRLPHGSAIWTRILMASVAALSLQWGTAGAAILDVMLTPTTGLGCRSGAYLIYATTSTLVWMMLVLSSILGHYAEESTHKHPLRPYIQPYKVHFATWFSVLLRRVGKTLAFCNAIWIVMTCIFQFTGFFSRCFCNSSVIGRGAAKAYDVIQFLAPDIVDMKMAWVGGLVLATGSAVLFILFINLMIIPSQS
ncbi:hypothetical protein E1B28_005856 [Marasmius oreades]|uniref:Transmembrane protein n=1 Tax=Marasmius oreades TaxID=181124 RepID=A0A9P7S408_9AGAR|nr:uncharacterized protein E1B28_005856 [Marasmius oreades]KAG7095066.1 hypothetical protein E1B28_005856 [Marasmius oreades]